MKLINWAVKLFNAIYVRHKLFLITTGTILVATFSWIFSKYTRTVTLTEIAILSIALTYIIDSTLHTFRTKKHFPLSYKIVTQQIIEIYSKKAILKDYQSTNNSIDKIIKSPLEYAAETLKGNLAPQFRPNDRYLEEIYDDKVKLVIAVTAENPNLWLDPTLCFYLINCCAVSLLKSKPNGALNLITRDFINSLNYQRKITEQLDTLNKLTRLAWDWRNDFKDFDFFRFFIYDREQKECLEKTVFPSLKASHDLFNIKSYFNQKEQIEESLRNNNKLPDFYAHIEFLWNEMDTKNKSSVSDYIAFKKIINKRKDDHSPEFLFLFKSHDANIRSVTVHTFVDGKPYHVEYEENATNNNGYQIIQSLVSHIAQSVQCIEEQYIPTGSHLNTSKSCLEWR